MRWQTLVTLTVDLALGEETHSPQAEGSISLPQQKAKGYCRFYSTKNGRSLLSLINCDVYLVSA